MYGPFETERQARETPAVRAVHAAFDAAPGPGAMRPHNRRLIEDACEAAGVGLGAYDRRIVAWLAGWEPQMCAVVAGLIRRAHASAPLAAELHGLARSIDRLLVGEHAGRQQIAEDTAARLHDIATALALGAAPVTALDTVQLDTVLDALADAAEHRYRHAGKACADCDSPDGPGLCPDHQRDLEQRDGYIALSRQLRQEAIQ